MGGGHKFVKEPLFFRTYKNYADQLIENYLQLLFPLYFR